VAEIILGIASSHGPILGSPVDDFLKHAERDMPIRRISISTVMR
jgi:hypothetical protein